MGVITVVPPTPVGRLGTWRIQTGDGVRAGDCWGPCFAGTTYDGTTTYAFPAEPFIYLDGGPLPIDSVDLPGGFEPLDAYVWELGGNHVLGGAACTLDVVCAALGIAKNQTGVGDMASEPETGMTLAALIGCAGTDLVITGHVTGLSGAVNPALVAAGGAIALTGTYEAPSWWWRVLGVDVCGNTYEGPFLQTGEDPGPPWIRYDPDDETAHPTPAILAVTPNHGLEAGGQAVTITGAGFGVGATVTFDGVPATDVVVTTDQVLTCVAPAHAAGSALVVVTNTDGVSS